MVLLPSRRDETSIPLVLLYKSKEKGHIYPLMHTTTHTHTSQTHTHTHTDIVIYTYLPTYIYTHTLARIYFFLHTHTHAHTHCTQCAECFVVFFTNKCFAFAILFSSTGGCNPQPGSSNCLCPLLSLSIPFPVAPQCHLSNEALVFQLILRPLSDTLCLQ